MRLHRLRVLDFGGIVEVDLEFGPGLNVLYGPNDLGKSTLAEAIRLAFLLPHTSTHIEDYVPWTGGRDPVIEMTFETEAQRIWRVRKEFRKGGAALLQESKNGTDFDDVERARKVDGKLRELLQWGIPEPGGAGGSKGLPASFLATALLSTQADVSSVLNDSLKNDSTGSGRERIAAALQAVAQDPLFVALLRATQARRDEAYTDRGARKTARGSVFKIAADQLNRVREEKDALQKVVDDSEGVEAQLRELISARDDREAVVAASAGTLATMERMAAEAAARTAAAEQMRLAHDGVVRIQRIAADVETATQHLETLSRRSAAAERTLEVSGVERTEAEAAFRAAEDAVRARGDDAATADIVARQRLELRLAAAHQAAKVAQLQIDAAAGAQALVEAVVSADAEHAAQAVQADGAGAALAAATTRQEAVSDQLRQVDRLERVVELRNADHQAALAQAAVDRETGLRARLETGTSNRVAVAARRAAITVPALSALAPMRRLDTELAAARGALNVGLVVTVTPAIAVDLRIRKDGSPVDSRSTAEPQDIEANTDVDIEIAGVAKVRVRGGRREAQRIVAALEERWRLEVAPHLAAAGAGDVESLTARVAEAQGLDTGIAAIDAELESLRSEIAPLSGSAAALTQARERAKTSRAAIDGITPSVESEARALGADPAGALRQRRQRLATDLEAARSTVNRAGSAQVLAGERARQSQLAVDAAKTARDTALTAFPDGVGIALASGRSALASALSERQQAEDELATRDRTRAEEKARIDEGLRAARTTLDQTRVAGEAAQAERTRAIADRAAESGRLAALQQQRDAEDLPAAEHRLQAATTNHAALPVPARLVTEAEVAAARIAVTRATADLEAIERDIQRATGRSPRSAARWRANGCAMRSRPTRWRRATSGRSKAITTRGCCCSSR